MPGNKKLLSCLGALLGALLAVPLGRLLMGRGLFSGAAAVTGFLLILGGSRLLSGRLNGLGLALAALLAPLAALPGLRYAWAEAILRENERFGCTMEEALELVPTVVFDPANRASLLWDLGGLLVPTLILTLATLQYLRSSRTSAR